LQFLGVGYQEILLVLILMFVVVGPQRLPMVAYQIGRAVRQMQRYARAVRDEFSDEYQYIETQYNTIRGDLGAAQQDLRQMQRELKQGESQLDAELKDVTQPLGTAVKSLETPAPNDKVVSISKAGSASSATNGAAAESPEAAIADEQTEGKPPLVF
jgi:sec-independent protein translocase protein TatB